MFWKKKKRKVEVKFLKYPMTDLSGVQQEIQLLLNCKRAELISLTTEIIAMESHGSNLLFVCLVYAKDVE